MLLDTIKIQFGEFQCILNVDAEKIRGISEWNVLRHCNAHYELHIPLSGSCLIDVEKNEIRVSQGQALLISPGKYHSAKEVNGEYVHFVIPFLVRNKVSGLQTFLDSISPCALVELSDFDFNLCRELISENKNKSMFWKENVRSIYSLLLSNVFRKLSFFTGNRIGGDGKIYDMRFEIVDNFFEHNLAGESTEESLAKQLNLSRRQLNRVLKTYYGMGFRDKLRHARMARAEWLLRTTDKSVSEICDDVGYASETSFLKAFKSHYSMSPRNYRKNHKE